MHQVKIFKGVENEVSQLEADINSWLKSSGARVVNITGNIAPQTGGAGGSSSAATLGQGPHAPSDVLVVVLYEQS